MAASVILIFIYVCYIFLLVKAVELGEEISSERFKVEGKVIPPKTVTPDWYTSVRILINGGEFCGFLTNEGNFVVNNIPSGSYVVEVATSDYWFEPVRVDITSKGKLRARKVNYLQSSAVQQVNYPIRFKAKAPANYFQVREVWKVTDVILNPMLLMMVFPLLIIMVVPKMINAADPETQREVQQSLTMPKYDMPELSEVMTSFFTGGNKKVTQKTKSGKKKV